MCQHLRFEVRGDDIIGRCTCLDCGEHPHISDALTNLSRELHEQMLRVLKLEKRLEEKLK